MQNSIGRFAATFLYSALEATHDRSISMILLNDLVYLYHGLVTKERTMNEEEACNSFTYIGKKEKEAAQKNYRAKRAILGPYHPCRSL